MFGKVEVRDQVWSCPGNSYLRPLPKRLGVSARGKSRRLQRALADFGSEKAFARAAQSVREHYGFELGASAARLATLSQARRAGDKLEREYAQPFRALPPAGAGQVVAQADGTMVCMVGRGPRGGRRPREWKEMRLMAARPQGGVETVYAATLGGVEAAGRRWGHCARGAGWGLGSLIHVVADGAEWIWRQSQEVFGAQGTFLCDFFHVGEYLAAAAPACGAGKEGRWRLTQRKRLLRGAAGKVVEALAEHEEAEGTLEEEAPVRRARRYLANRMDCLDYPRAQRLGLPIGSGMIESGHRHVLQARLKQAGTAWLPENAELMGQLRVLKANNGWDLFWQ